MTLENHSSKERIQASLNSEKNLGDAGAYPTVTALVTNSQDMENPLVTLDADQDYQNINLTFKQKTMQSSLDQDAPTTKLTDKAEPVGRRREL